MTKSADNLEPLRKPVECPNCGKVSNRAEYPFCSTRCRQVDLNRWFTGGYAIPTPTGDFDDGEERGNQ